MTAALASLEPSQQALINSLGYTQTELQGLISATAENTRAIRENNKEIIKTNFEDNAEYAQNNNQEFLNEILATTLETKTDEILESYKKDSSGWTGSDKNNMNE
jgi:hypothetical protein